MSTKQKIKVVQYMWGAQNLSYDLDRKINKAYCERHGYVHIVRTHSPRTDRSVHWEKIPTMRHELCDCDYLLFLDADAFFYSHELRIEDELLPQLEDKQIMMAADYACEEMRHQPNKPNSGTILVRNSETTAEMLKVWDESSERPELEELRFHSFHEQDACYRTIWQEYAEDVKLLKEYYLMNGYKGIFIRHLMATSDEERSSIVRKFMDDRDSCEYLTNTTKSKR